MKEICSKDINQNKKGIALLKNLGVFIPLNDSFSLNIDGL